MGARACKCCKPDHEEEPRATGAYNIATSSRSDSMIPIASDCATIQSSNTRRRRVSPRSVDNLIAETVVMMNKMGLFGYNVEPPHVLQKLNAIGDDAEGWLQIIMSLIRLIPMNNPMGQVVIIVVLDDCPLPTKETVMHLLKIINLPKYTGVKNRKRMNEQRNICAILGLLAEKLPGPSSVAMLNTFTMEYLLTNLERTTIDQVTLNTLITIEKFAQITENKVKIKKHLDDLLRNPLIELENLLLSKDCIEAQVGFCARWLLDNIFPVSGRQLSYLNVDSCNINAMLNSKDASEHLKISPDGLEARCDAYSFESVRCTFEVHEGIWFYEVTLLTFGVMQIGWASMQSLYRNYEGYGIGDDEYSISYDGCRRQVWYSAVNTPLVENRQTWKCGDIVGCLINLKENYVRFYLNGDVVAQDNRIFQVANAKDGMYAAASFMSFQHCRFNFGRDPFKYPPTDVEFRAFNDHGKLSESDKLILPRHVQYEQLRNVSITEDSCILCFDNKASDMLLPCYHTGFCEMCVKKLPKCPVCRCTTFGSRKV